MTQPSRLPTIERLGNELAECRMALDHQREIVAELLLHVGIPATCTGPNCGKKVLVVRHQGTLGRSTAFNPDGTHHIETCADRKRMKNG